jgi:hypothetical protein
MVDNNVRIIANAILLGFTIPPMDPAELYKYREDYGKDVVTEALQALSKGDWKAFRHEDKTPVENIHDWIYRTFCMED